MYSDFAMIQGIAIKSKSFMKLLLQLAAFHTYIDWIRCSKALNNILPSNL